MRTLACAALAAAFLALGTGPGSAEVNYPWCLITSGESDGVYSCGYVSEAQCRMTRVGTEMCVRNPRYQATPQEPVRPRAQQRQRRSD